MDQLFYSFGSQFFSNRSSVQASELLMRSCRKIPIEIGPISRTVYINYITVPEALKNFPHFQILFAFRGTGTRYLYNTLLKGSSTTREKAFLLRLHLGVANVWSWPTFAASPQRLDWKHLGGGLTSWILVEKLGVRFCSNGLYTSREKLACWLQSLHLMPIASPSFQTVWNVHFHRRTANPVVSCAGRFQRPWKDLSSRALWPQCSPVKWWCPDIYRHLT